MCFCDENGTVNPGELKLATGLHPGSCQFPVLDYNAVGKQLYTAAGFWALGLGFDLELNVN